MMAKEMQSLPTCYAGNLCAISGLDGSLIKSGTISSSENVCPFKTMKFSVSPVVQYAVSVKNPKDLPKLLEGLKKLEKIDPIIKITTNDREKIVAGAGELHLDISIRRLEDDFMKGIKVIKSKPIVSLRESILNKTITNLKTDKSEVNLIVTKSPNKHNRIYVNAQPLTNKLIEDLENGLIDTSQLKNIKPFSKIISGNENYDFIKSDAERIWTFGIEDSLPNILCDLTKGQTHMKRAKPLFINGFHSVIEEGVLCHEKLRGIRFDIRDARIHNDSSHSGAAQLIPMSRRGYYGAMLESKPILMEPVYSIDIATDISVQNKVISALQQKNGTFSETIFKQGTMISVKGYLPVLESFGFTQFLREKAKFANPQMQFSHWTPMKGNPLEEGNRAYQSLMDIRKRKDMKLEIPNIKSFFDRV
jgi:elongation factor 2